LGVAVHKDPHSKAFAAVDDPNAKHTFFLTRRDALDPSMCPPTCKIVVVKSMLSLFGQLRWASRLSLEVSTPEFNSAANPHRRVEFHDESSNISSLGRSATAAVIKMKPADRFRQLEEGAVEIERMCEELHVLHCEDIRVHRLCVSSSFR